MKAWVYLPIFRSKSCFTKELWFTLSGFMDLVEGDLGDKREEVDLEELDAKDFKL